MRRSLTILLWMLLGALAAGGSAGYFLLQSNQDRLELIHEAQAAKYESEQTKRNSQQLIDETNKKLAEAQRIADQSRDQLTQYQQQQAWLSQAMKLSKPSPSILKSWGEIVSIPLKASIRIPSRNQGWETSAGIAIGSKNALTSTSTGQWLSISPFEQKLFDSMTQNLINKQEIAWNSNGHLLLGWQGQWNGITGSTIILRATDIATSTHLIWARTNNDVPLQRVMDTMATMTLAQ